MTENQLIKLKNRLINVQAQLSGASVVLSKEPFISRTTQGRLFKEKEPLRLLRGIE